LSSASRAHRSAFRSRPLDAIHIASANTLRDRLGTEVIFATHDRQQATAARALGFEIIGI
jgi:hypothetical protein